jgi:RNA polymerase sigma-70 factor, ECF subfamily
MKLAAAFRARARASQAAELTDLELETRLTALVERGRARWPQLPLDPETFAGEIAARTPSEDALAKLYVEDLHLAVACAQQVPGALDAFEASCLGAGPLNAALKHIEASRHFIDEVKQTVREQLFLPPRRITAYSGRGSLASWTKVTTLRIALRQRSQRGEIREADGEAQAAASDPELHLLHQRYGKQFEEALAASFARLEDEQHNLLKLQLIGGLGTAQIAALFSVDRSTIKRRLAACRELLLEETQAALREKLGLSPESFQSLSRVLASQLNLSLARLLKTRA